MKLHELSPAPGSRKVRIRVGRGLGSGLGKTSGRGHKGQNLVLVAAYVQVLKVARCLYTVDCQNAASKIFLQKNMLK